MSITSNVFALLLLATWYQPGEIEGFYTKGKIIHPTELSATGPGFQRLFLPRDRGWASSGLVGLLLGAAERIHTDFPDSGLLQVGDASAQTGGTISGHASHQNGLDVDLAFLRTDLEVQDPAGTNGFLEDFLQSDGTLSPLLDLPRNYALVRWWADTGVLNRIFVDAKIKTAFCTMAAAEGLALEEQEFLRRLRPWPHHSDHLHVRIQCPVDSPKCIAQDEPPEGSGCVEARRIANGEIEWVPDASELLDSRYMNI